MMALGSKHGGKCLKRPAFTLVEAVISLVIISGLLVAALNTVGASRLSQYKTSLRCQGQLLAQSLLAEIVAQAYADPNGAAVFGPETGEGSSTRTDFDDVDDYDNWLASPPTEKDGTPMSTWTDWQRMVTVEWIDPLDPTQIEASESQAKAVTVEISYKNMPVASLAMIKTASGL